MGISLAQLVNKFPYAVDMAVRVPFIHKQLNRIIIGRYTRFAPERPRKFSLKSNYTSWSSLTDRTYSGRHLPECKSLREKPDIREVAELWRRPDGQETPSEDTSVLFAYFAQWFTDSFLRTDNENPRKNKSNHEIDFCQLYGQTPKQTQILRAHVDGKLKHQIINGEAYPPYLFDPEKTTKDNWVFASDEFAELHPRAELERNFKNFPADRIKYAYATGLEHGNTAIGYTTLVTLFLREHNRVCDELKAAYPDWDDERLFETARMILTVLLLNIVLREYVAQVGVVNFPFQAELGWAEKQPWYRGNWINLEFSLLYRWHSMVPDHLEIGDQQLTAKDYRHNPSLLHQLGIGTIITAASKQTAGKIGLGNTHDMFLDAMPPGSAEPSVQERSLQMARDCNLRSMNDYREYFSLPRIKNFDELTDDPALAAKLREVYKHPDDIEWLTGIFAEKHGSLEMMGDLMLRMVAYDAFTHALTNPLLSKNIYGPETFSPVGMEIINSTTCFRDIVARNIKNPGQMTCSFQSIKPVPGPKRFAPVLRIFETVDMVMGRGWKRHYEARRDRLGTTVFRSHAFKSGVLIMDAKGCEVFTNWDGRLAKGNGFGAVTVPRELTGNVKPSVFDDGYKHQKYKALYQKILMTRRSDFQSTFKSVLAQHSDTWAQKGSVNFTEDLERFAIDFLFQWYFDIEIDPDQTRDLYNNIFSHQPRILHRLNPWSKLKESQKTLNGILAAVLDSEKFREYSAMAAQDLLYNTHETAQQLLFLVGMNNYLGIQSLLKSIIGELSNHGDYAKSLRDELANGAPATALLEPMIKETLRLHPPVFFIFGIAQRDFTLHSKSGSYAIKKGEHLTGAIPFVQLDSDAYASPETFDPTRHFDEPHLIWSHSQHSASVTPTDHGCPGKDVAAYAGAMFAQFMLENFDWTLDSPAKWTDKKYSLNVAAPMGKMPAKITRRMPS